MADRDLAPDEPALLDCRIVDGWNYGDIAVHLGVPRGVLADRVRRLRTDLWQKAKVLELRSFDGGARWNAGFVQVGETGRFRPASAGARAAA